MAPLRLVFRITTPITAHHRVRHACGEFFASRAAQAQHVQAYPATIVASPGLHVLDARGILIADTKFEFGLSPDGTLVLGDEAFTPDSSRFWPADEYEPGRPQPSFDKQFVRDYCETLGWDKAYPGPELPEDIVAGTRARYVEAFERLTEIPFEDYFASPEVVL